LTGTRSARHDCQVPTDTFTDGTSVVIEVRRRRHRSLLHRTGGRARGPVRNRRPTRYPIFAAPQHPQPSPGSGTAEGAADRPRPTGSPHGDAMTSTNATILARVVDQRLAAPVCSGAGRRGGDLFPLSLERFQDRSILDDAPRHLRVTPTARRVVWRPGLPCAWMDRSGETHRMDHVQDVLGRRTVPVIDGSHRCKRSNPDRSGDV
jgi:hypothetical protein